MRKRRKNNRRFPNQIKAIVGFSKRDNDNNKVKFQTVAIINTPALPRIGEAVYILGIDSLRKVKNVIYDFESKNIKIVIEGNYIEKEEGK